MAVYYKSISCNPLTPLVRFVVDLLYNYLPSVLRRCWLGGMQEGHPACKKTERWGAGVAIYLERVADLHTCMFQLMLLPLTVSCFSEIQIGFTFWYRLTWVVPEKRPLNGCVCVCVCCTITTLSTVDKILMDTARQQSFLYIRAIERNASIKVIYKLIFLQPWPVNKTETRNAVARTDCFADTSEHIHVYSLVFHSSCSPLSVVVSCCRLI